MQRLLLIAAGIGIWLPLVPTAIFTGLVYNDGSSPRAAMAIAALWLIAGQVEIIAIVLLLAYAIWVKPWKTKGPAYAAFIVHSCAAGLFILGGLVFFLLLVGAE